MRLRIQPRPGGTPDSDSRHTKETRARSEACHYLRRLLALGDNPPTDRAMGKRFRAGLPKRPALYFFSPFAAGFSTSTSSSSAKLLVATPARARADGRGEPIRANRWDARVAASRARVGYVPRATAGDRRATARHATACAVSAPGRDRRARATPRATPAFYRKAGVPPPSGLRAGGRVVPA